RLLKERDISDHRSLRIRFMDRSVGGGFCLSADDEERDTGLGVAIEPMMWGRVDERAFANVNARPWCTEHCESNACLGVGRLAFTLQDSRAALHPIRLPQAVEGAASLAVDPPIMRHQVQAWTVGRRVPGIEPPKAVNHP